MPQPASDDRRVQLKSILDPGLLLHTSSSPPRDKGKRRAEDDGQGRNNLDRNRIKRQISRVNSLLLSTDSPRYTRKQPQDSISTSKVALSSPSVSTINSFGSQTVADLVSLEDDMAAREGVKLSTRQASHSTDLDHRRVLYGNKRKRMEREAGMSEGAVNIPERSTSAQMAIQTDPADEEWNNIWGRWDDNLGATLSRCEAQVSSKIELKRVENVEALLQDVEKSMPSSQLSQISIQSDDGRFRSQIIFHQQTGLEQESLDQSIEWAEDSSRSRIDEQLLIDSQSDDEGNEADETTVQHRIEMLCADKQIQLNPVRHLIFQGDSAKGECRESKRIILI